MNIYRLFKFPTVGNVSQHGTLQQILSNALPLYMTQLAGKEPNNFQQLSKLVELNSISLISLLSRIKVIHQQISAYSKSFLIKLKALTFT